MKRGAGKLKKERGIWVLQTGEPLPAAVTDELLQRIREERDSANLGEDASAENSCCMANSNLPATKLPLK
jgi:hypothetical protein